MIVVLFLVAVCAAVTRKLLSVPEAAERLNVGERYIRRLIFEKRISYTKIGGSLVRLSEDDLESFIEAGRVEARESSPRLARRRLGGLSQ